eukprot:TRINITY_DN7049_c0_g1_i1.p2 TRINITY_DN7049_c0_g1~~TRINITY_DN7049_c0_g1_i1.p2  ORF type:complete len:530 (-),score=109.41 TRINITY_DN7049_c0_g1_i1:2265-3854(-)
MSLQPVPRLAFLTTVTPASQASRFLRPEGQQLPSGDYLRPDDHTRRGSIPKKNIYLDPQGQQLTVPFTIEFATPVRSLPPGWKEDCKDFLVTVPDLAVERPDSPVGASEAFEQLKDVLRTHLEAAENAEEPAARRRDSYSVVPTDFDIISPISKGAYGRVLLARKKATGKLFAIKVMAKVDMIRKNAMERCKLERDILARMDNPFVVKLHYSFQTPSHLYFVLEYANGGDVGSLLESMGCLAEDQVRVYLAEVVLALEYLHERNIVHRDLKPDNLLINKNGHILLADFGLSDLEERKDATTLASATTNSRASISVARGPVRVVGTPDYVAPEIVEGQTATFASDWWSLGVLAFELLTGCPPFNAATVEEVFDNILRGDIPWGDELSAEAHEFITALLNRDPAQRLGSGGISNVKSHPFFEGIDWQTLRTRPGFFVPEPTSDDDTSYFSRRFTVTSSELQVLAGTAMATPRQRCSVMLTDFNFRRASRLPSMWSTASDSPSESTTPSATLTAPHSSVGQMPVIVTPENLS